MTMQDRFDHRLHVIRQSLFYAFALYLIPVLGAYFRPWMAFLAPFALLASVLALVRAVRALRCMHCGQPLAGRLIAWQDGKLLDFPKELQACPFCKYDFSAQTDHDGLPELLSGYERDGQYVGVVQLDSGARPHRYELALRGKAKDVFSNVLRMRPFRTGSGPCRFFFVPDPGRGGPRDGEAELLIRVEGDAETEDVSLNAPAPLVAALDWLHGLRDPDQVLGVTLQPAE